jgi:DNA-binding response OmpR family regulator
MTVLLIEPNILAGKLYASALQKISCEVKLASDGQSALYAMDKFNIQCVILELDMSAHNGFEFLYEFCSQEDWNKIPIVIHSSINPNLFVKMLTPWSDLNVIEYLYKPTSSLMDLQNSIKSVLVNLSSNEF